MKVRAIRGATQLETDSVEEMRRAVVDLLTTLFSENEISTDELVSILFTATSDIHSDFPAAAARTLELGAIPLICAQEIDVAGALPRVVRVMVHAYSHRTHAEIKHIYRGGAQSLRKDIAQ
jgi:chorismate mutase